MTSSPAGTSAITIDAALPHRRGRGRRRVLIAVVGIVAILIVGAAALWLISREAMGGRAQGARLARVERSPEWRDGKFRNALPRVDGPFLKTLREFFFGGSAYRVPAAPIVTVSRTRADYDVPPGSGLRVTWFGHSSMLLEIDGTRVLIDPNWGERASPFTFAGPKRFFEPPMPLGELPAVDIVVISHDHYDHLDLPTVKALAARGTRFAVPLGIGAHLAAWGVPEEKIRELDWWESDTVGTLVLTATPTRHFSGRGLVRDMTLWVGWAMTGPRHRAYYSGDAAMSDAFLDIGTRLGPFDLTMIEVGQYDALWPDVHLGPEQAVRAHRMLKGDAMLPVHWRLFDLALHSWTEPIERTLAAAEREGVRVVVPRPGAALEPATRTPLARWWPTVPWKTSDEAPVQSTGVERLMSDVPAQR